MPESSKIAIVSSNANKVMEMETILQEYDIPTVRKEVVTVEIQSSELEDIAREKASSAYRVLKNTLIVEDAGLFIDALGGFPGPYSSFVNQTIGCHGILTLLRNKTQRKALFRSALVFVDRTGEFRSFLGEVAGTIANDLSGSHGFGFDPIFIPDGSRKTYGSMKDEEKNRNSHRSIAARRFAEWFSRGRS